MPGEKRKADVLEKIEEAHEGMTDVQVQRRTAARV